MKTLHADVIIHVTLIIFALIAGAFSRDPALVWALVALGVYLK